MTITQNRDGTLQIAVNELSGLSYNLEAIKHADESMYNGFKSPKRFFCTFRR